MSTGIDFVIGGKDNATSAMDKVDQALGRLQARTGKLAEATKTMVVNVTGAKSTMSGLSTGAASVDKAAKATSTQIAGLSASLAKLKAVAGPLLAVFAAVKTVTAGVGAIRDSAAAYDEQADSIRGLESALSSGIGPAAGMSEKLQAAAANLESLTGVSERATLGLMKQASHLGVHSGQLDQVARAAIGLAEATGKDLTEATNMAAEAVQGNFSAFSKVLPQINMMVSAEEKLAAVQELAARGMKIKAGQADTLAGVTARTQNAIQRLMETVGAMLAPLRMIAAQGIGSLADSLQKALAPAAELAGKAIEGMKPIFEALQTSIKVAVHVGKVAFAALWESIKAVGSAIGQVLGVQSVDAANKFKQVAQVLVDTVVAVANKIIGGITMIEVVVANLGPIWEAMKASAELQLVRLSEIINHALTKVIPAYTKWFADNFTNMMRDTFNAVVTISQNAMTKIADITKLGWDFIASKGEGGLNLFLARMTVAANKSLLDGFTATTSALPEIAARQITEREQQLAEKIGKIGENLGQQFTDKFNSRMVKLGEDVGEKLSKDINLNLNVARFGDRPQLQAAEGRLTTRGPVERQSQMISSMDQTLKKIEVKMTEEASNSYVIAENSIKTAENTAKKAPEINLVGVPE